MKIRKSAFPLVKTAWAVLMLAMLIGIGGCTRNFYRNAADKEVNDILAEKDKDPRWKIEQYHVYPDPRARFGDSTNPDRSPMPPDDDATLNMSPHPQGPGHAGVGDVWGTAYLEMIKLWDSQNRTEREAILAADMELFGQRDRRKFPVRAYFEEAVNDKVHTGFLLKMDQSIELGVINSPQYQNFREELYLAALPVTLQRFSFAYQWAAIADVIRQWAGRDSGQTNNWTSNSAIGFSKLFSTGALLTADWANQTVVNLGGPAAGVSSVSTVNLTAMQPFLQGGGKAVTLEPLTQTERTLFYSIRGFARFREQFNVAVALGASLPPDLATAAGTNNTTNPISALAALGIASTDVAGGFVGYLSTLYRECDMAVDKKLANDFQRALKILEGYQEGGMYSPLQVDQARTSYLQAQNNVLVDQQFVINALDQFKLVLGLPANLPLVLDDTPARPITAQFDRYYEVIDDSDASSRLLEQQEQLPPEKMRPFLVQMFARDPLVLGTVFQKQVPISWADWQKAKDKDLQDRLFERAKTRRTLLDLKADLDLKGQTLSPTDLQALRANDFESDLGLLEQALRRYEKKPWENVAKKEQAQTDKLKLARLVTHAAKNVLVSARNERFEKVGTLWPGLTPAVFSDVDLVTEDVDKAQQLAVQAALSNRWDLMNARAQVVDAWRQLRVTANALMGVFNVGYNLQSETPPGMHPLAFNSANTVQQINFNFQLPLNRLAQRNAYRAALINYQIARRSLMNIQDNVAAQVRFDVRQLQLFAANYRIQKRVIQSYYSQVESALEVIIAPSDPDALKSSGTAGQAAAAALTQQYLSTLGNLNNAQTKMYDIWLSFYATRMQLYLDLERLPMDERGVWTEEALRTSPEAAPAPLAPMTALPPATAPAPVAATPAAPPLANDTRPVQFLPPLLQAPDGK